MFYKALQKLTNRENLSEQESYLAFTEILEKELPEVQVASFLGALRGKGETADEIVGCVKVLREKGETLTTNHPFVIDTCGTGADHSGTFNISTAAALVAAGCDLVIAKHGNRSVSSLCGSADVLESLEIPCLANRALDEKALNELGIAFLFAPKYHPVLKKLAPLRKELGFKTIFNIAGPLANPVRAQKMGQIIGVFEKRLVRIVAEVLKKLGISIAWVVHSLDGLDEISNGAPTSIAQLKEGVITEMQLNPESLGISPCHLKELKGESAKENAQIILSVLDGQRGGARDVVCLNAAAACIVGGKTTDFKEALKIAEESIDSGKAKQVYLKLKEFINK